MEKQVDKYGTLFKSAAASGFGGSNTPDKGGEGRPFKDMGWDEFNKLADEHPEIVGLPRKR